MDVSAVDSFIINWPYTHTNEYMDVYVCRTPFLPTILANFAFSRNCVCLNNLYIKCGKSSLNCAHRVSPKNNYVLVQFSLFAFYIITITFSFKMYKIYNIHI